MNTAFWLPTRPYGVIDAINRMAAATGSVRYAQLAANADYNGHCVSVYFNTYRGYWLAEYQWGERVVLCRGGLEECLRAGKAEYDRGALGASAHAHYPEMKYANDKAPAESRDDFARACAEAGYTSEAVLSQEAHDATWRTPLHDLVNDAMNYERHGIAPAVGFLANSKSVAEYEAKIEAFVAERRAARVAARAS